MECYDITIMNEKYILEKEITERKMCKFSTVHNGTAFLNFATGYSHDYTIVFVGESSKNTLVMNFTGIENVDDIKPFQVIQYAAALANQFPDIFTSSETTIICDCLDAFDDEVDVHIYHNTLCKDIYYNAAKDEVVGLGNRTLSDLLTEPDKGLIIQL